MTNLQREEWIRQLSAGRTPVLTNAEARDFGDSIELAEREAQDRLEAECEKSYKEGFSDGQEK